MSLADKKCVPCEGGVLPLLEDEAMVLLRQLGDVWHLNADGHLVAEFKFKTFRQALNFANRVGEVADQEEHHPDLYISWGKCCIEIWTHKIQGLTESDFILAAKIDKL